MKQSLARWLHWSTWGKQNNQQDGPPDLEALIKRFFGFGKKDNGNQSPFERHAQQKKKSEPKSFWGLAGIIAVIVVIVWALSGIFIVQQAERGVIFRFGKYVQTVRPGMHWIPRFIESKTVLNVGQNYTMNLSQTMLTSEENLVDVDFAVQYRIGNIEDFLFRVVDPVQSLRQIVDSAIRQVVGTSKLDDILTVGRAKVAQRVQAQVDKLVTRYQLGIIVTDVAMQTAKAPEEVKDAFDDVIKAREDKQRVQNEAMSYANKIVPVANGRAQRILRQAQAYKQQVILQAQGHVAQFDALLPIYEKSPQVTAERMYLDTMQSVLQKSHVSVVEGGKASQNLFYIPLPKVKAHTQQEAAQ